MAKLKVSVDDTSNTYLNNKFLFHRVENIVEKEENAGFQHFLLFPQYFQMDLFSGAPKVVKYIALIFLLLVNFATS